MAMLSVCERGGVEGGSVGRKGGKGGREDSAGSMKDLKMGY